MKTLIFLVCCALVVKSSWCDGISIIGSKFVRPNRPYTVAVVNPLNKIVFVKLSLKCDDFTRENTLRLNSSSGGIVQIPVPSIESSSDCTFSAINDGGEVVINYDASLEIPDKTVSIFIQTDKPVYKPGDELRFRVVVVDIETKPVTNIKSIEVLIEDAHQNSVRQWSYAKLNKGVFETSYQMAAIPVLGTWTITVTAVDGSISNEKKQSFEVKDYVLPKFAVRVWPTETLLIENRKISLNVESHYTFGQRVEGKVQVKLYLDKYRNRESHSVVRSINGKTEVEFRLDDELDVAEEEDYTLVNATVAVTDSITNATVNITQLIPVYLKPYKISLVKPSLYYRPGEPYHFKVSVKDHTGIPLKKGEKIKISFDEGEQQAPLDGQGLASFVIPTPNAVENITVSAEFDSVNYEDVGVIEGLESSSTQYFQIQTKERIKIGRKASFTVSSNHLITHFTYLVVTRGTIVDFGHIKPKKKKIQQFSLKLTEAMAPKATLMVFCVKDGQFIADFFDLNFESFVNDFEFKLNKMDEDQYRPNEDIYVEGKAQQDSIIFFHAIDQSALLMGHTKFDLTKQEILEDLDHYRGEGRFNSLDWFNSMGLFFRSHSVVDLYGSSRAKRSPYFSSLGQQTKQKAILLRLEFPEAWLWRNSSMNRRDSFEIQDFVPHTITSWHVTAFALSPTRGLGIMDYSRKFTVGKPFYMIAHLPYSIKRGEVALIQVTLYNFLGSTVTTDVVLFNKHGEIEFVDKSSTDDYSRSKTIVLPSHRVKAVSFLIKAKKLGEIAIKIEAKSDLASDGLEHLLRVTPESRRVDKNAPRFIELKGHSTQTFEITCDIPRAADAGSIQIKAAVDHDLIGIPAKHSESLINFPNGGGHLNLLTLVPNIVALEYLSSTRKNADETLRQKAIDYLKKGYDNQLKYRASNGAFRQWDKETGKESIFLTALVANSFIMASKHIPVDRAVIKQAFSWMASKQRSDGCFKEVGEKVYSPMQESSSFVPLTAFVVAAIKENDNFSIEYQSLVDKAVECLEDKFYSLSSDYDRALATYALSRANHPNREKFLDKLLESSTLTDNDNGRYWNQDSLSVEIAGYALLSYVAQDLPLQGRQVFHWLNTQRYASGEFKGVQSTFVGLKAMSKMAQALIKHPIDYRVKIKSIVSGSQPRIWPFDINKYNALSTTELNLPDNYRVFEVEFTGTGYGYFQLSYQYNINIESDKKSFNLHLDLLPKSNHEVQVLKVCLSYIPHESKGRSEKTLVEVFLPSGLVVNDNSVRDLSPGREIKTTLRSFDGSAMYVYYNSVGTNQVCFVVTAHRQFKIANHQPSYVVVYDTEHRERFAVERYEGIVLQTCDICENQDCKSLKC